MENLDYKTSDLEYSILKVLEEHYSCAEDIIQKLKKNKIDFEERKIFPVLSGLQLNKLLCYNWLENEDGLPIKHFHLTRTGFFFIHK